MIAVRAYINGESRTYMCQHIKDAEALLDVFAQLGIDANFI